MLRGDIKEEKEVIEKIDLKDSLNLKVKKELNKAKVKLNKEENQESQENRENPDSLENKESPESKRKAKMFPRETAEREVTETVNNDLFTLKYFEHSLYE